MERKILVTGGAGFIGSALAEQLIQNKDNKVTIVDNLSTGKKKKLPPVKKYDNAQFIKCDVNNYREIAEVMLANKYDYVFHYAAVVGVQRTLNNPVSVLKDIDGIRYILELSKNTNVKRVFYASSSEVYGEPVEFPQNEHTTPLNSKLPYAVVKNVGEAFLRSYHKEFGLEYTIFRFFNTYGPKQSIDFVMSKFIRLAQKNKPITIYGDGKQTRTFCFIKDNIEATIRALNENKYVNDVVNVGSDNEIQIRELAKLIIKVTNSDSELKHLPPLEEGDMQRRHPDISKMRDLLQRELTPIETGIERVIKQSKF